jgi:hypothetical protein
MASGLSFSAMETGTESASGNTNSLLLFEEFLHDKHKKTTTIVNRNTLTFIQDDMLFETKIKKKTDYQYIWQFTFPVLNFQKT